MNDKRSRSAAVAIVSVLLVALNLRPVFPSLSVLLPEIIASTGVTTTSRNRPRRVSRPETATAGSSGTVVTRLSMIRAFALEWRTPCPPPGARAMGEKPHIAAK